MNARIASKVLHMLASMAAPKEGYGLTTREKEILGLMTEGRSRSQGLAGRAPVAVIGHLSAPTGTSAPYRAGVIFILCSRLSVANAQQQLPSGSYTISEAACVTDAGYGR